MKRFLIPAFFVIDADTQEEAEQLAGWMKQDANAWVGHTRKTNVLLMDAELPTREVPIVAGETELPHTYKWEPPCQCKTCQDLGLTSSE